MKSILPKYLLAAAVALSLSAVAHAQLQINGINGFFSNVSPAGSATVTNNGYNTVNTFTSPPSPGQSVVITATPSAAPLTLVLGSSSFVPVEAFSIDKQNVSGAGISSSYQFNLQFDFAGGAATDLSLAYTITTLATSATTYTYAITPSFQSGTFSVDANNYTYVVIGDGFSGTVGVGGSASNGDVHFNIQVAQVLTPVPEASTYGMLGALSLAGFAAYRRFRNLLSFA